jgi:sterol desaturase/sphingolipid hydroxylase (fatty acid hydroxylase superfamily)
MSLPSSGERPPHADASQPPAWQVAVPSTGVREHLTLSGLLLGSATLAVVLAALAIHAEIIFALVVFAVVFIPLEKMFALRPQRIFREGWHTDLVHFLVNNVALNLLLFASVAVIGTTLRLLTPDTWQAAVGSQPAWLQIVEALVVAELGGYAGHRAAHQVPFLWRFHKVHHSVSEMDWLAATHLHPLDQAFIRSCSILPIYALGFTKASLGVFVTILTFHAIFLHANVSFTFGPLRWVIGTPEFHHWHHANVPEAYNTNYAALFPVVDKIFGTIFLPRGRRPAVYGVDEEQPRGYLRQLTWPLRRSGDYKATAP